MSMPPSHDYPWLRVDLTVGDAHSRLVIDPAQIHGGIKSLLIAQDNPDSTPEEKRLKQLMKTAIKGIFLTFGGRFLDLLFQSKEHPRPGKGDDLLDWYADIFAKIVVTRCAENVLTLTAGGYHFGTSEPIVIDEIRSLTPAECEPGATGQQAAGEGHRTPRTITEGHA